MVDKVSMKFLEFIEDILNKILLIILNQMLKLIPARLKNAYTKLLEFVAKTHAFIKQSPFILLDLVKSSTTSVKPYLSPKGALTFFKEMKDFSEKYYRENKASGIKKMKVILAFPFIFIKNWCSTLTRWQIYALMSLTFASIISGFYIFLSVEKIIVAEISRSRYPASSADYERPVYYKKELRHLDLSSFRLPIFIPSLNELRSIDIDFTMTLSNKAAKQFLEKHEFELRDHLLHEVELVQAHFPLEEEGREIIKTKLRKEINSFLVTNKVEGSVVEIQIIYILAN